MIEAYKMVNGLNDSEVGNILNMWHEETKRTDLRGHSKKLFLKRPRTCLRKNPFVLRVVETWNGLPSSIVGIRSNRPDTRSSRLTVIRFCIIAGQIARR